MLAGRVRWGITEGVGQGVRSRRGRGGAEAGDSVTRGWECCGRGKKGRGKKGRSVMMSVFGGGGVVRWGEGKRRRRGWAGQGWNGMRGTPIKRWW